MAIDKREIIYRQILTLDIANQKYYTSFFALVGLLLGKEEKLILEEKYLNICKEFEDMKGHIPTFVEVEILFFNMRDTGRKLKIRSKGGGIKWITSKDIDIKLSEIRKWCYDKLYIIQDDIRFKDPYLQAL